MKPEDREQMIELCRRIARETDVKKLTIWIKELNAIVQRRIDHLKKAH